MKIISNYKDYYDYLKGIWGEDPKLILNRNTKYIHKERYFNDMHILSLIIGGKLCQFYYDGKEYYFGKEIKQFDRIGDWSRKEGYYRVSIGSQTGRQRSAYISKDINDGYEYINQEYSCPIIYNYTSWCLDELHEQEWKIFPLLKSTPITQYIDATDVYKWISEYLAKEVDKIENITIISTDKEKLINKGFDPKTSFRPNIKI